METRGKPRIIPERLREGREARGFSVARLAETIGVTRQAVAQFETGRTLPSAETFEKICDLLRLPVTFFVAPPFSARMEGRTVFFRSLKKAHADDRNLYKTRLAWLQDIVAYLEQFIDFPKVNIPEAILTDELNWADPGAIERAANALRQAWGLGKGPLPNLTALLEANGIIIAKEKMQSGSLDGLSCWQMGRPVLLLNMGDNSAVRSRMDAAHELGHMVLHNDVELTNENIAAIEKQAFRFASAFLMPAESFAQEVYSTSLQHLTLLKRRWLVSIQAMIYRCKDLQLLSDQQVRYLFSQLNLRNERIVERLDDELPVEKPTLLRQATELLLNNGVQTKEQIKESLKLPAEDIESLCGLSPGSLSRGKVVPLVLVKKRDQAQA